MKILVLPDIHGRQFWKEPCENIDEYDKIVFIGDYLDPYDFEHISVKDAIANFDEILEFADKNSDKVDLLLGNHDMCYYSKRYKSFSMWHSRHSYKHCDEIRQKFEEHKDKFKIAVTYDDVLFTHAGCTPGWLLTVLGQDYTLTSLDDLCSSLNNLLETDRGLKRLFMISSDRGGRDRYASCIWADESDTMWYQEILKNPKAEFSKTSLDVIRMKQVFGHTLQVFQNKDGEIYYGDPIEVGNNKMLDNGKAYILDTESFTITQI